jgi:hypothetical protein
MKKLAIFVEGKTERVFVERLILLCVEEKKLNITLLEASGGKKGTARVIKVAFSTPLNEAQEFQVQIMECGNDDRVASDVRDSYDKLVAAGFSVIIGIRDVRPDHVLAQVPQLRRVSKYKVKTKPVDPLIVLAVLEVEAWFLADHTHYERIHPALNCPRILAAFGFDPATGDMTVRPVPNEDLHAIYKLEGLAYRKTGRHIERTVEVLDYEYIYFEMVNRFVDLKNLVDALQNFFVPPAAAAA